MGEGTAHSDAPRDLVRLDAVARGDPDLEHGARHRRDDAAGDHRGGGPTGRTHDRTRGQGQPARHHDGQAVQVAGQRRETRVLDHVGDGEAPRAERRDDGTDAGDPGDDHEREAVRERGLGLTCCPVSNSFVTSDMKAAEIGSLLQAGVRVTVNSDDPAYFGGYVSENYTALAEAARLGPAEVVRLARNSFEVAWLTPSARDAFLAELDAYAGRRDNEEIR